MDFGLVFEILFLFFKLEENLAPQCCHVIGDSWLAFSGCWVCHFVVFINIVKIFCIQEKQKIKKSQFLRGFF